MTLHNPEHTINHIKQLLNADQKSQIRLKANGGNSILFVCEPQHEQEYITALTAMLEVDRFQIINLNQIVIDYVDNHKDEIEMLFDILKGSVHQVFKDPGGQDYPDLFGYVILAISQAYEANKIPVIIRSGALYGSGIDNIHIIENEVVMKAKLPLLILYPATKHEDKLLFLSQRPASKYRCMIVN